MRLLTMRKGTGYSLGVHTSLGILDVQLAANEFGVELPNSMLELIQGGEMSIKALQQVIEKALISKSNMFLFLEEGVSYGPCVTTPEKILCVGLNYRKHACVFGYSVGNDLSARDLQPKQGQWLLGKTCDGFAPLGPYLVTADEILDPNNLKMECRINGELRQTSNTKDMIFNCAEIISYISQSMTLKPGDIIFTGTPEGVIIGYPRAEQIWLKAGDEIQVSIEKLGELKNAIG